MKRGGKNKNLINEQFWKRFGGLVASGGVVVVWWRGSHLAAW